MDRRRQKYVRIIWGLVLGSAVGALYLFGAFDAPELKSLDARFLIRGRTDPRSPIVIVSIDQDSFDELELQWPWPRSLHATLVDTLSKGGPLAIGIDVLFVTPSRSGPKEDRPLAEAVGRAGNVVLAGFFSEVKSSVYAKANLNPPIPLIRKKAKGYGFINFPLDFDGFVRRATLAREHQGVLRPSFAYRLYDLVAGGRDGEPPLEPILINFRGPKGTFPTIPYYQVIQGEISPEAFRGKIVLVGAMAASLQDLFPTPFAAEHRMSGVEIQANLLETLLQDIPLFHPPRLFHLLLVVGAALAAAFIGFRFRPLKGFALVATLTLTYAGFCIGAFVLGNVWLEVVPPSGSLILGYGVVVLTNYAREEREKRRLSRYFSPDILKEVVRHPERLTLRTSKRRVTVLFSDIRGFASIAERLSAEEVVGLLHDYLTAMTEIVFKHGGTVDKFIGDAIMALFGAPLEYEDHAARAVRAAIEMQERAGALSSGWAAKCGGPLRIGIGIHTGEAVVGTMGSAQRLEFTAIGDTVNLASRLEGLARDFKVAIVISQETQQQIGEVFPIQPLGELKVKGREAPVSVYAVDSAVRRAAPRVPIEVPISLSLDREFAVFASIKNLSRSGAAIATPSPLPVKEVVSIRLRLPETPADLLIKGRVAWSREGEAGIEFLDLTAEERDTLEGVVTRWAPAVVRE